MDLQTLLALAWGSRATSFYQPSLPGWDSSCVNTLPERIKPGAPKGCLDEECLGLSLE